MSLDIGTLVVSRTGRDKKTVLAVIGNTDTHLVLANGRKRRMEKPKLKKEKHVSILAIKLDDPAKEKLLQGRLTNKMLYREIKQSLLSETV